MTSRNRSILRRVTASGAAATLAALLAAPAAATTYTLATFTDDATVNGNCTLREALRAANGDVTVDACPAGTLDDSIVLPTGTYDFSGQESLSGAGSLSITSADLNPFHVTVNLHAAGRFLDLSGGGSYVLGGLGITNGSANVGDANGGAISAVDTVTMTIFNFRFVSNHAGSEGGALYFASSWPGALTVHNGAFLSNGVTSTSAPAAAGGGAYVSVAAGGHADLRDVTFLSNTVSDSVNGASGGALLLEATDFGSTATCVRCNFQSNAATETAGLAFSSGGAALVASHLSGRVQLTDCRFVGNSATGNDGALKAAALFASADANGSVALERLFVDNNGGSAGYQTYDVSLYNYSGGISFLDSQVTFGADSGLFVWSQSQTVLGHLTVADYPENGGDFTVDGSGVVYLQNSILAYNLYSDITTSGPPAAFFLTTNFLGGEPHFVDEPAGNYRLEVTSPAVDHGTSAAFTVQLADLDHRMRTVGAATDIGCYEYGGLFADGFDVGDVHSWSAATP